nr:MULTISPECIES: Gly-Xaa-Xaa repeat protein [Bacillus]
MINYFINYTPIAKLFKINCCATDKLVKLIAEIQAILVQYGSGYLGGGTTGATGPQRAQGPAGAQGPQGISRTSWFSRGYGCPRASRGIQGPAGTPIPVTIAAIGNSNPQTISPGTNIQFNQVFELNNINFNDTSDTLTILETGV